MGKLFVALYVQTLLRHISRHLRKTELFIISKFQNYVFTIKETIDSIQGFRNVLMISDNDQPLIISYKKNFCFAGQNLYQKI